ncbi:hypothetical protein DFJ73DRAFT_790424 [Zopfochytrium polystomum]|nr:hypothetical protein DFJ73DRAFT_790424 [Zopfochytrium polystomum]
MVGPPAGPHEEVNAAFPRHHQHQQHQQQQYQHQHQQQQQQHEQRSNSNNLRALAFKAVSHQKRQVFANVCCISIVQTVLNNAATIEDIQFCSNFPSLHDDGFPRYNTSDPLVYGANVTNGKAVNFMRHVYNDVSLRSNPGRVFWFGEDYPHNSDIYERNSDASLSQRIDRQDDLSPSYGGWISVLANGSNTDAINRFTQNQLNIWGVASASSDALSAILGAQTSSPVPVDSLQSFLFYTDLPTFVDPPYTPTAAATSANTAGAGLLGAIGRRLFANISATTGLQDFLPVPYFLPPSSSAVTPATSDLALDDDLSLRIQSLLVQLSQLNKTVLQQASPTSAELTDFYLRAGALTARMPHGGVFLDALSGDGAAAELSSRIVLHVGGDKRVDAAGSFPSKGQRLLTFLTQLDQATVKYFGATVGSGGRLAGAKITQGLRAFPETQSTRTKYEFAGIVGRILFPFGVSFLLPIFVITLVKGLPVILLLFFVWGNAQVTLAFFFASFFNRSRMALVLVFLLVLCGVIISIVTNNIFDDGDFPSALFIWPPFAFYRALYVLNLASYDPSKRPYISTDMTKSNEVTLAMLYMTAEVLVYGLAAVYLTAVLPSQYGQRRPWHYPVTSLLSRISRPAARRPTTTPDASLSASLLRAEPATDSTTSLEDADVATERRRVDLGAYPADTPLVVSHLRKVYPSRAPGAAAKVAVRDVSFAAERGVVLGLLGPNGAGKTTLISMLTGLYEVSAGRAVLSGYDIRTEMDEVYKVIGICPQFDILWEDLTVEEHLFFYCRLKGASRRDERQTVETVLEQVSLTTVRRRLTKRLSGGEKRRLSIAIALVGSPQVVFLDEPTTGLDPEVRRLIWNIIHRAKEDKTIVITTHSMEEAEAVCQRIGIMSKGVLRCYANPLRLKELYGAGFRLFFNTHPTHTARACAWVEAAVLPRGGFAKVDAFAASSSYEFAAAPGAVARIFEIMEEGRARAGIVDWGVSQTTLEELSFAVFGKFEIPALR